MPKFIMLVGLPAAGKDTWAREYIKKHPNTVIHSSDDIREELYGDASCQNNPEKVFEIMAARTIKSLQEGKDVIYNATNLKQKKRKLIHNQVKKQTNAICYCYVFIAPIEVCKERNATRERKVSEHVYDKMLRSFQVPSVNEGFEDIDTIWAWDGDSSEYEREIIKKVIAFGDQKNPHHTYTLFEHCEICGKIATKKDYWQVEVAARIHDYGKIYTQSFDEEGVAHYYGHEGYSAYLSLCFGYPLETAQIVNYHMFPYTNGANVWRDRLGKKLWKKIKLLHECDELAH